MKNPCRLILLLTIIKYCCRIRLSHFFHFFFPFCISFGVGTFISVYYTWPLFCYEEIFGTGSISTPPVHLSPHNSSIIYLPGNLSLSIELLPSHEYEVCLDERAYSGDPVKQCLVFPNGTVFCQPEDGTSSHCLPPSLVESTSGSPVIGFSMLKTTLNIAFYVFIHPNFVKCEVVLSEMSSLETVWYDLLNCKFYIAMFAVSLVPFVLVVAGFLVLCVCCWRKRSKLKK